MNTLNQEVFEPAFVTFTIKISANQTQDLIISKLNKRKRGHYGPPKGKQCVIFVDDLNMPVKEVYGAQPPIELLRQYFDHKNWYDLKDTTPVYLHDILLTAAMGPPGGSRQEIYGRFHKHSAVGLQGKWFPQRHHKKRSTNCCCNLRYLSSCHGKLTTNTC